MGGRSLLTSYKIHLRVPQQVPRSDLQNLDVSSEHLCRWSNMPRYFEHPMEPCIRHLGSSNLD
ncbi:UNVERIFIED_CONTAM: hypothetical protein GTU68_067480 [Idotea baltica]|nr:hypothetical protein [Idotea baltica]